ncbi:organic cation/carnitine transporter 2-like [Ciona intestinalis]
MSTLKLNDIGASGVYQVKMSLLLFNTTLVSSILLLGSVYILYTPEHRCYVQYNASIVNTRTTLMRNNENNSTKQSGPNAFIPTEVNKDGDVILSQCSRYSQSITGNASISSENRSTIYCDQGWEYTKPDYVQSATTEFNLVCKDAFHNPLATTLQMGGYMIGSLIGGKVSDIYGRRKAILVSMGINIFCPTLMAFTPHVVGLHIGLFLFGIATTMRAATANVLCKMCRL